MLISILFSKKAKLITFWIFLIMKKKIYMEKNWEIVAILLLVLYTIEDLLYNEVIDTSKTANNWDMVIIHVDLNSGNGTLKFIDSSMDQEKRS